MGGGRGRPGGGAARPAAAGHAREEPAGLLHCRGVGGCRGCLLLPDGRGRSGWRGGSHHLRELFVHLRIRLWLHDQHAPHVVHLLLLLRKVPHELRRLVGLLLIDQRRQMFLLRPHPYQLLLLVLGCLQLRCNCRILLQKGAQPGNVGGLLDLERQVVLGGCAQGKVWVWKGVSRERAGKQQAATKNEPAWSPRAAAACAFSR